MGNSLAKDAQLVLRAAQDGDTQLVRNILEKDPRRINSVTAIKRSSILHVAAKRDLPELILICLDPYVEAVRDEIRTDTYPGPACQKLRRIVNARDVFYRTPLLVAAKAGNLRCVRQLAEYAANLFAIDRDANTALHLAALHERQEVVEYLLAKTRARGILDRLVNKRNICGFSALHYAAWRSHGPIVRALLAAGADMSFANDRVFDAYVPVPVGSTPLHLAVTRGSAEVVMALLEYYAVRELEAVPGEPHPPDPRSQSNLYGMNPAQLAAHLRHRRLSRLLHPAVPIGSLFSESELSAIRRRGHPMPTLQALAAKALQKHLLAALAAALPPSTPAAAAAGGGEAVGGGGQQGGQKGADPASSSSRGVSGGEAGAAAGDRSRSPQQRARGGRAAAAAGGQQTGASPAAAAAAAAAGGGGGSSSRSRRRKQPHAALAGSPGPAEAGADSEEARSSSRALLRASSLRRALPAGSRGLSRVRALLTGCTSGGVGAAPGEGGSSGAGRQQRGGVADGLSTMSSSGSRLEELAASAPSFYVGEAPMAADVVVGEVHHQEGPSEEEVEEEVHGAAAAATSTAGAAAAPDVGQAGGGGDAGIDQGPTRGSSSSSSSRPGCPDIKVSSSSHGSTSSSSRPGSPQWAGRQEEGGLLTSQHTTDLEVVCSSPCSSKQGTDVTRFTSSSHLSDTEHPGQVLVTADAAGACPGRYTSGRCELEPATPVSDATGCGPHTSSSDDRCLSDEDLDMCGVCLDAPVNIALQSCQHPLCAGCAERVVSMQTTRPAACPFCRLHISGFQALQLTL